MWGVWVGWGREHPSHNWGVWVCIFFGFLCMRGCALSPQDPQKNPQVFGTVLKDGASADPDPRTPPRLGGLGGYPDGREDIGSLLYHVLFRNPEYIYLYTPTEFWGGPDPPFTWGGLPPSPQPPTISSRSPASLFIGFLMGFKSNNQSIEGGRTPTQNVGDVEGGGNPPT